MTQEITKVKTRAALPQVHDAALPIMDTDRFGQMQRIATLMASMSLLPDHLALDRNKRPLPDTVRIANCFRIVNQALRWNFDPFAMIDETYVVGGKLGYQGKLVAAVVNTRANLSKRLSYEFAGQGDNLTITVSGTMEGENSPRTVTLSVGQAKTENKMWRTDPEQKLVYSGVTKWARRHCPEVILGVLTDDDIDRIAAGEFAAQSPSSGAAAMNQIAHQMDEEAAPGQTVVTEPQPQPAEVVDMETGEVIEPDVPESDQSNDVEEALAASDAPPIPANITLDWALERLRARGGTRSRFDKFVKLNGARGSTMAEWFNGAPMEKRYEWVGMIDAGEFNAQP